MTTRLILARHGRTEWNDAMRFQGRSDVPLNERGWSESACIAERLADEPIRAIYTSDLARSRDTALVIARRLDKPMVVEPRLREIDLGEWQGLTYAEVGRRYLRAAAPLPAYPVDEPAPGGECLRQLQTRVVDAVTMIAARHCDECVALVMHGACLRVLMCAWLGMDLSAYWRLQFDSGSISEASVNGNGGAVVSRLNDTAHLFVREERE